MLRFCIVSIAISSNGSGGDDDDDDAEHGQNHFNNYSW